jgi:hypothetical protein
MVLPSLGAVTIVESVADLALVSAQDTPVLVLRYHPAHEGGGGLFFWDPTNTSQPDGGTLFAGPTLTGRWRRMFDAGSVSVKWFGALGNGLAIDTPAIKNALRAVAQGGEVVFPPGTYLLDFDADHAGPFSLAVPGSNITLRGTKGQSWLRHMNHVTPPPVAILYVEDVSHITIRDMGFDGNWGNSVHGSDNLAGLNQDTQPNPQNHGIVIRAATDVLVENCLFRQIYGDATWIGYDRSSGSTVSRDITFRGCNVDMCARHGIALGGNTDGVHVSDCRFTNIHFRAFDTDPGGGSFARDVVIERTLLGGWWGRENPKHVANSPLSILGGGGLVPPSQAIFARKFRVRDCTIEGAVQVTNAYDVKIESCRIVADFTGHSFSPVLVEGSADDVWVIDNEIYCRTTNEEQQSAISVTVQVASLGPYQPAGVRIHGNRIHARLRSHGISVTGTGGIYSGTRGIASATSADTLTDNAATWTPNQWLGHTVVTRGVCAVVIANTVHDLTINTMFADGVGWRSPLGDPAPTPAAGGYAILSKQGLVDIANNFIDLTDDGNGQGGHGIFVHSDVNTNATGMRVRIQGNEFLNANNAGIEIDGTNIAGPFLSLEVVDNTARDNQMAPDAHGHILPAPTCIATVHFSTPPATTLDQSVTKLILRGNQADGALAIVSGLNDGRWLIYDDKVAQWAGFGSPEGAVVANPGALYQRVDGGPNQTLYMKVSDLATATGWQACAGA